MLPIMLITKKKFNLILLELKTKEDMFNSALENLSNINLQLAQVGEFIAMFQQNEDISEEEMKEQELMIQQQQEQMQQMVVAGIKSALQEILASKDNQEMLISYTSEIISRAGAQSGSAVQNEMLNSFRNKEGEIDLGAMLVSTIMPKLQGALGGKNGSPSVPGKSEGSSW